MSHRKSSQNDWHKLANTPDYNDTFDDLYEEEIVRDSKQKKREQVRFGLKEDYWRQKEEEEGCQEKDSQRYPCYPTPNSCYWWWARLILNWDWKRFKCRLVNKPLPIGAGVTTLTQEP